MNKVKEFKLASTEGFKVKQADDAEGVYIEGYASTPIVDRDEEIVPVSSINTTQWEKNPILLYMHDRTKPIGKVVAFEKRPEGFWVKAYISQAVEKTMGIISLIKDEVLRAFSIGFRMKDYFINREGRFVYNDIELTEISVVTIPANPDALFSFVKSLREEAQERDKSKENIKEDIETMEKETKLQEMEETLKRLMSEKEAVEKALKEKEEAEKKAKEEAEKAELKNSIEKFASSIKSVSDAIDTLKEELKSVKEELETVKEAKPRIEVPTANEKTINTFMDKYKDALIEGQLFGRKFTDTTVFKKLPEGAKAITFDSQFQTMVHDRILDDIKQKAPLFDLFMKMGSDAKTDVYPFTGSVNAGWGTLSLTNYDLSGKVQFDYYKAIAGVEYKYEDEDQAVISWLPKMRQDIVTALAETLDDAIINSDGASTYKGLLGYANDNANTVYTVADANNKITAAELRAARTQMLKYGVNPKDVVIVLNSYKYLQLLDDPELVTADKAGNMATLINGSVGFVNGSNIIVNDSFNGNDTASATEYSAIMFNKNMFATKAKSILVEIDKNIQSQNRVIVGSINASFIPLIPLNAGALPSTAPIVVALSNGI